MNARAALLVVAALCAGCGSVQGYDGERREADEVARINGDPPVTAGKPITAILRRVDGRTLSFGQTGVEVLPGSHELLVDCRIAETGNITRHSLEVEVSAGRRYRLEAEAGPGLRECTRVSLEAID
jgi:hypothetical protein